MSMAKVKTRCTELQENGFQIFFFRRTPLGILTIKVENEKNDNPSVQMILKSRGI